MTEENSLELMSRAISVGASSVRLITGMRFIIDATGAARGNLSTGIVFLSSALPIFYNNAI